MTALGPVVRAGVGRRRLQGLVMLLTTMMSVTAALLGAGLLVGAHAPFEQGFARQHGAHLTVAFDPAEVTDDQLAATERLPGVTATAGPFPTVQLQPAIGTNQEQLPVGAALAPLLLVGRDESGGAVDRLDLTAGHWLTGPGQVVLSAHDSPLQVGDTLELPGRPALTVVGLARSAGQSADAWVTTGQLAALAPAGTATGRQLLYRFARAGTDAELTADRTELAAAVPPGAITGAASYLKIELATDKSTATFVPFVVAFALIGLVMSVLIIGIVVSGTIGAATRRIGILKAVGFTPAQVVRGYVGQALLPGGTGVLLGLLLGNLAALPVLAKAGEAFDAGPQPVAPWLDLVVGLGALVAVAGSALVPALRAGRLSTVAALGTARTPGSGRGRTVRRLLGRLPLPRPVSLGLATPFAKPGRSAVMVAAVLLGAVGVTFGVGLAVSLNGITSGMERERPAQIQVLPTPGGRLPTAADLPQVAARIAADPDTGRFVAISRTTVSVAALAGPTTVVGYDGDASWAAYQMVAGRWFERPGEAVVPSAFLQATGTRIGDTLTLTGNGRTAPVTIVGESFDVAESGMLVRTPTASLARLGLPVDPMSLDYEVDAKPGHDLDQTMRSLDAALAPYGFGPNSIHPPFNPTVLSMDALAAMLTGLLVAVASLGVLNTVLLDTRERVHDLGVHKALGMSPRQTVVMVLTSVTGIGALAAVLGTPLGIALHHAILPAMGRAAGTRMPSVDLTVYHPALVLPLLVVPLVLATLAALPPALWTARTPTAAALRTE
ncbi:FtsX-like permease family protein [Kitasatospora sp. NPDC058965]|uniref:ABC transporter permease n=1 Tax=Kitasatospora sp. NPDC058965 TaxID=3346682 RepID=UPI0036CC4E5D